MRVNLKLCLVFIIDTKVVVCHCRCVVHNFFLAAPSSATAETSLTRLLDWTCHKCALCGNSAVSTPSRPDLLLFFRSLLLRFDIGPLSFHFKFTIN